MREVGQEVAQKKKETGMGQYLGLDEVKGTGKKSMLKSNIGKVWSLFRYTVY